jgi:hypothetical protein
VGTTYKVIRREVLANVLPVLQLSVNLEFNAHFLDRTLASDFSMAPQLSEGLAAQGCAAAS